LEPRRGAGSSLQVISVPLSDHASALDAIPGHRYGLFGAKAARSDSTHAIITSVVVVVDTSVFIVALLGRPGGASRGALRACLSQRLQPLMGAALFTKYESLMTREELLAGSSLFPLEREELFDAFLNVCRWTTIYYGWRPNLREGDHHLIELAVAGGARGIVTENVRDFQGAELHFAGLRILRPEDILKEI
jgi:predicted nucleic acid-binding protein